MEFKLNKIDTELRQKINDSTKEGKVHTKHGIVISKEKKGQSKGNFESELMKYDNKKKKIVIGASKTEHIDVDAFKDNLDEKENLQLYGSVLDVRK